MRLETLDTPIGAALLVTDAEGALLALDWADHADRLARLLRQHHGAGGELRGYAGGLSRKRWLLAHEGAPVPAWQEPLFSSGAGGSDGGTSTE